MSKPLKLWNGRAGILHNWRRPEPFDHVYVAAHSRADAARLLREAATKVSGGSFNEGQIAREIATYFSAGCWGNAMKDITPERGVWVSKGYDEKPWRIL